MFQFLNFVEKKHSVTLNNYKSLWEWSVERSNLGKFWDCVWDFTGTVGEKGEAEVSDKR